MKAGSIQNDQPLDDVDFSTTDTNPYIDQSAGELPGGPNILVNLNTAEPR